MIGLLFSGAVTSAMHFAGASAGATIAVWLWSRRERYGPAGSAVFAALLATAFWSLIVAAIGTGSTEARLAEAARNLAWLFAVYRLFAGDGRHTSVAQIRPLVLAAAFVQLLQPCLVLVGARSVHSPHVAALLFHLSAMFSLLVTVGGLVLIHNLVSGAGSEARRTLLWPAGALLTLWGFDLNFYTVAYLTDRWPVELSSARGLLSFVAPLLIAMGGERASEPLRFRPSRAVAFQSVSLILIGGYLVAMIGAAQGLAYLGGDVARVFQFALLTVMVVALVLVLPSRRARGWLRVTLAKHLFQHRYDYRAEWLRFTQTIGRASEGSPPLQERVIQSLADITDSAAGLLLAPNEHGGLELAARWQWPTAEVPAVALEPGGVAFLERGGFIIDLAALRAGTDRHGERDVLPEWLLHEPRATALVPLLHFDRLVGAVVLARPAIVRQLDWEDFDLLRIVGRQLASYLAEHNGQEALAEAGRFDDFHRRIAFVMHDIKNLASQLSLLARNAEIHAEKPEFRADMLITLRSSADRLNTLLARLSRYGGAVERVETVEVSAVADAVVAQYRPVHQVVLSDRQMCSVAAHRDSLWQVLCHLVQNAIDASPDGAPVFVSIGSDGIHGRIDVVDSGTGMSPEFIRNRLFKPFVSTKPGGFGIGAYEARELVRAMGGRLEVESREGLGSRFTVRLPLVAAAGILQNMSRIDQKVA